MRWAYIGLQQIITRYMMPGLRILQWIVVRYNALYLPVQVPEGYNWLPYFSRFADDLPRLTVVKSSRAPASPSPQGLPGTTATAELHWPTTLAMSLTALVPHEPFLQFLLLRPMRASLMPIPFWGAGAAPTRATALTARMLKMAEKHIMRRVERVERGWGHQQEAGGVDKRLCKNSPRFCRQSVILADYHDQLQGRPRARRHSCGTRRHRIRSHHPISRAAWSKRTSPSPEKVRLPVPLKPG